jgi:hypothetical protein
MDASIDTENKKRKIRCAPFALALICFFLPFIQVSCQGQKSTSLTGLQLATGTEIVQRDPWSGRKEIQTIPSEKSIVFVLICAAVATGAAFVAGKKGSLIPAISGGLGFVLMLVAKSRLDNQTLEEGQGMLTIEYQVGFIAVCLLLLGGAIYCLLQFKAENLTNQSVDQSKI